MEDIDQLLDIIWQDEKTTAEPIDKDDVNRIYELLTKENAITPKGKHTTQDINIALLEGTPSITVMSYCIRKLNQKERKKNTGHTPSEAIISGTKYKRFAKMNVFAEFKPSVVTHEETKPKVIETFQLIDLSQDSRRLAAKK